MPLPPDFQFSQACLQDYVECRRRFQLRYGLDLAWPAVEAEPIDGYEADVQDGKTFHRLVHQHQMGLPAGPLAEIAAEAGEAQRVSVWWQNYLAGAVADLPPQRYPELSLSAPVGSHRLIAKYDLIAVEPGIRAVILDWKTSRRRPSHAWLVSRLQTRVYRYLLVRSGAHLNGGEELQPTQVEMIYWFASFPDQTGRLPYDTTQFDADARYLASLVAEIAQAEDADFPMTKDARRCRFCPYRSLCERGVEAGAMGTADAEDGPDVEAGIETETSFDFEQISEIAF